ncbi:MAG: hypothetical protein MI794_12530 [Pseudomonadales bacterium]|nr:hypothetical protein [Pseudomonadales bacterium]
MTCREILVFVFLYLCSWPLHAADEAVEFFDHYVALGDAFDKDIVNLYADDAVIRSYRAYPFGFERNMELTGVQWKDLVSQVMPLSKLKGDRSLFSDISITNLDDGYRIEANRYSVLKCYTDSGYYMVIKYMDDGDLRIVEEYFETRPLPDC